MKKVLWVSRHILTQEQVEGIKKVLCDEFEYTPYDKTVKNAEELVEQIKETKADALVAVLPVGLLSEVFAETDIKILVPRSKRKLIPDPNGGESKVVFEYDGFEVIDDLVYVSHIIK